MVEVLLQMLKTNPPTQSKRIFWPREFTSKPVRVVGPSGEVEQVPPHPVSSQRLAECTRCSPQLPQDKTVLPTPVSDLPVNSSEDRVYGLQVIQLGVFLTQIDDTVREGDGERMMRN